jgi:Rho guanine nucleotide exchange factor 10
MVSYHAHQGPVKFIVTATALQKKDQDGARDSPPPGPEPQSEDQKDMLPGEGPPSRPSHSDPDTAVWLGDTLGLTSQKSDLSSSSGSLSLSHGSSSLEHRSEDSSVCDLLKDPSAYCRSRAQRSRRAKASSVLVVCGGQGHRRVHKKARQPQEEVMSSVMVWQIPLLSA